MTTPLAALHDNRFAFPFHPTDVYSPVEMYTGTFDVLKLKEDANVTISRRLSSLSGNCIEEKVWNLITATRYRRGPANNLDDAKDVDFEKMHNSIQQGAPIEFTISFYPFKILNPLKTLATKAYQVDIGEVASVLRFYEITETINQLYKGGAIFHITMDGIKYHDIFGASRNEASLYSENISKIMNYFGMNNLNLIEETKLYPPQYDEIRAFTIEEVRDEIEHGVPETVELLNKLQSNMGLALCTHEYARSDLALAFNNEFSNTYLKEICPQALDARLNIAERAYEAAIKYIATYRTPYKCGVYNSHLPNAIKCTVHPKPGQVGLYPVNKETQLFPHHGQGFYKKGVIRNLSEIRISLAADLLRMKESFRGIVLPSEKFPFSDGIHPFVLVTEENVN